MPNLPAPLLLASLLQLSNALNTGISIWAYNDLSCSNSSDIGVISRANLVTDGTCASLVRTGPVAFQVANSYKPFTACQVNVYPPPANAGEKPCTGLPVAAGETGTNDDGRCFAYAEYSHYVVEGCDPAWVGAQKRAEAEEKARALRLRGVIAGTVVAGFLVVVAGSTWVVLRARERMRMEAHGKVEEIEVEGRGRR